MRHPYRFKQPARVAFATKRALKAILKKPATAKPAAAKKIVPSTGRPSLPPPDSQRVTYKGAYIYTMAQKSKYRIIMEPPLWRTEIVVGWHSPEPTQDVWNKVLEKIDDWKRPSYV